MAKVFVTIKSIKSPNKTVKFACKKTQAWTSAALRPLTSALAKNMKPNEFINWLRKNYPKHASKLNNGLNREEISLAEKEMNLEFPDELKEFYSCANGEVSTLDEDLPIFVEGFNFCSISQMINHWKLKNKINAKDDLDSNTGNNEKIKDLWWSSKWIPIGLDISGGTICIDLEPGPYGVKGQIIEVSKLGPENVLSTSLALFLEKQVNDTENRIINWDKDSEIFTRY